MNIYPIQTILPFESYDLDDDSLIVKEENTELGPLHIGLCKGLDFTSRFQLPIVGPAKCSTPPETLCALYRLKNASGKETICPHFFTDDRHFESLWKQPYRYINVLSKYKQVISTDFSLYMDMLQPQKYWNDFRNKLLAAFYQYYGIDVIPAPSWADISDIERYMEGWPRHSMVAINSTGIGNDRFSKKVWRDGYEAMLDILKPTHILRYGGIQDGERTEISTYYDNNNKKGFRYGC